MSYLNVKKGFDKQLTDVTTQHIVRHIALDDLS